MLRILGLITLLVCACTFGYIVINTDHPRAHSSRAFGAEGGIERPLRDDATPVRPPIRINALDLWVEYRQNEIGADSRYKGHFLVVTGLAAGIRKDFLDRPVIDVEGSQGYGPVHARLRPSAMLEASSLRIYSRVALLCKGSGMMMGEPMLEDCVLEAQDASEETPKPTAQESVAEIPVPASQQQSASNQVSSPEAESYTNPRFGYQFAYPASFSRVARTDLPDSVAFVSPDGTVSIVAIGSMATDHTVAEAYAFELDAIHAEPTYQAKGKTWIVLSWYDGGKAYYLKRFVGEGSQNTFIVSFPEDRLTENNYLPAMINRSFRPGDLTQAH